MQLDFHYCAIKVLAQKAGFSATEAEVIAFASQYVDDACEHKPMRVKGLPARFRKDGSRVFNPTCTAWEGINFFRTFYAEVQRKVFIPFHFLPARDYKEGRESRRLVVAPGAKIAKELLKDVVDSFKSPLINEAQEREFALARLGVALHTFADTYSHQGFSGRRSWRENYRWKVQFLSKKGKGWQNIGFLGGLLRFPLYLLPGIGHAKALNVPDEPALCWREKKARSADFHDHENPVRCMAAAKAIYAALCECSIYDPEPWLDFSPELEVAFISGSGKKETEQMSAWKKVFANVVFDYDKTRWRKQSLKGPVSWEWWPSIFYGVPLWNFAGSNQFFQYHAAAHYQRIWVLNRITPHPTLFGALGDPFR